MYQSYFACLISNLSKSGDGTLDMLALQWWEDQVSCQQSIVGGQQAFDFHLKYLHGPKKLRIRMNEDYPSTCPHNLGSFAFMLNIVSGWSDSSEGYYTVCFSPFAALRGVISFVIHMLVMVRIIVFIRMVVLFFSSAVVVVSVSSLSPSAMSLLSLLLTHVISYSRMCLGLTQSSCCMAVSRM